MPDWPSHSGLDRVGRALTVGDAYSKSALGTSAGVAHTKGAWSQLIASCPFDAEGFSFSITNSTGGAWSGLIDIGIGGSGSEVVIVPNLLVIPLVNDSLSAWYYIPMAIPAGARVAARFQQSASGNLDGEIVPCAGGFSGQRPFQKCTAYGVNTGASTGTTLTGDYPGSWTAIADNVEEHGAVLVSCWQSATNGNAISGNYEIGISASGAGSVERILVPSIPVFIAASQRGYRFSVGALPLRIPPSSKLWGRFNNAGHASQQLQVAVHGFS